MSQRHVILAIEKNKLRHDKANNILSTNGLLKARQAKQEIVLDIIDDVIQTQENDDVLKNTHSEADIEIQKVHPITSDEPDDSIKRKKNKKKSIT